VRFGVDAGRPAALGLFFAFAFGPLFSVCLARPSSALRVVFRFFMRKNIPALAA
jgi:hypothetical protein